MVVPIDVECPQCGEVFSSSADTSEGDYTTIEDCAVCCRPMEIRITCSPGRVDDIQVSAA